MQSNPNRFTGIDRHGAAITGATNDSAAVVAERLYDRRVLSARVMNADGDVIGGVGVCEGRRSWWGDASTPPHSADQGKTS